MKQKIILTATLIALIQVTHFSAQADLNSAGKTWVRQDLNTVYFAAKPEIQVALTHIGADDQYWDQLSVEVAYTSDTAKSQIAAVRAQYPGYDVRRLIQSKSGTFSLSIASLGVQEVLTPQPGVDGPFVRYQAYIARVNAEIFRAALRSDPNAVSITGDAKVEVPELKLVEHVELPESICADLVQPDSTVMDVMTRLPVALASVDLKSIKYVTTRDALKQSIIENCLQLDFGSGINSMAELLHAKPIRVTNAVLKGETRLEGTTPTNIPLMFVQKRSIDGVAL